jgi:hypothetical protein
MVGRSFQSETEPCESNLHIGIVEPGQADTTQHFNYLCLVLIVLSLVLTPTPDLLLRQSYVY